MTHSTEVDKIIPALVKAQGEFLPIAHNAEGQARGGKFGYSNLAAILEGVRPILTGCRLALTQTMARPTAEAPRLLETTLWHESGQWLGSSLDLDFTGLSNQEMGIRITYVKRWEAAALLGISTERDREESGYRTGYSGGQRRGTNGGGRPRSDYPRDGAAAAAPVEVTDDYPGRPESWSDWVTVAVNERNLDFLEQQRIAGAPKDKRVSEVMTRFSAANVVAAALMAGNFLRREQLARDDDPTKRDSGKAFRLAGEFFAKSPEWAQWCKDEVMNHYQNKQDNLARALKVYGPNAALPSPAVANGAAAPH